MADADDPATDHAAERVVDLSVDREPAWTAWLTALASAGGPQSST